MGIERRKEMTRKDKRTNQKKDGKEEGKKGKRKKYLRTT